MRFQIKFEELDEIFQGYKWAYILQHLTDDLPEVFHNLFVAFLTKPTKRKQALAQDDHGDSTDSDVPLTKLMKGKPVPRAESSEAIDVQAKVSAVKKSSTKFKERIEASYKKPLIRDSVESECEEVHCDDLDDNESDDEESCKLP
jgi:hypothetical protein